MTVATQLKKGNVIKLNGELFKILTLTHITPGKGNAVVQTDLRSLKTGVKTNKRFRSAEDVEAAEVRTLKMQYLYSEGEVYHFMDQESYEQYELSKELLGDSMFYIIEENIYDVSTYEDNPIGIELPARMVQKIVETDPAQKGIQGKVKPATCASGLVVKVPLFIEEGEEIVVSTDDGSYIERAKK